MIVIPFDPKISSYQTFEINLGEFVCSIRALWNEVDEHWFFDFTTDLGKRTSIRLIEGANILGKYNGLGYDGNFRLIRTNAMISSKSAYESIGTDYKLTFGTTQEWQEYDGV